MGTWTEENWPSASIGFWSTQVWYLKIRLHYNVSHLLESSPTYAVLMESSRYPLVLAASRRRALVSPKKPLECLVLGSYFQSVNRLFKNARRKFFFSFKELHIQHYVLINPHPVMRCFPQVLHRQVL